MPFSSIFSRIESFIFYLFLAVFPFQYRKILFYPGWQFSEWQSYAFYATDILIIVLFFYWLIRIFSEPKWRFSGDLIDSLLVLCLLIGLVSVLMADNTNLAWYGLTRLASGAVIFWYARYYALRRFDNIDMLWAVAFGGFFQALVSIGQFLIQSDIGLRYLGEGLLNPHTPGVAVFHDWFGDKVMRSYGTTPHPNILAVCLLVSLSSLLSLWFKFRDSFFHVSRYPSASLRASTLHLFTFVILIGFWLTFSRTVIFVWALLWLAGMTSLWFYSKPQAKRLLAVTAVSAGLFLTLWWPQALNRVFISSQEEAVQLRVYFAQESIKEPANIAGVGIGNFVPWLIERNPHQPLWRYQPVHNLYLLIFTELGWLGVIAFALFLISLVRSVFDSFKKDISPALISLSALVLGLVFIALFDHLFWTLQQGRIVWWASLGVLVAIVNRRS